MRWGCRMLVVLLPMLLSACATMSTLGVHREIKKEFNERQGLLEEYQQTKDPALLTETYKLNPIVAAVTLAPSRIPDMVADGVDINYEVPAADPERLFHDKPTTALITAFELSPFSHSLEVASLLLEAGADPNLLLPLCRMPLRFFYGRNPEEAVQMAALLLKHGAKPGTLCGYQPVADRAEEKGGKLLAEVLRDAQKLGVEQALARLENRDERLAQAAREKAAAEAERERQREVARKIRLQKQSVIAQSFKSDPDLRTALSGLKQSARPCVTLHRMGNEVHSFNCNAWLEGEVYSSSTCQTYQEQLIDVNNRQRSQACTAYEKNRQQLTQLFGSNASIAGDVIQEALSDLANLPDIENLYRAELRQMKTVRDREARNEKAGEDRRYQQGMYNLARHIEQSFGSKTAADQIIEQSVADTRQTLHAIGSAQKMAKINADLEAINRRLADLDSQSQPAKQTYRGKVSADAAEHHRRTARGNANASAEANADKAKVQAACVAQSESKGPMPNVPQSYCQYVFADNSDTVSIGWADYSSEFNAESGTLEQAQAAIHSPLLKKATRICESRGYSRVHHPETYAFNRVAHRVSDCKENQRMDSTFHLCVGSASFICAR